MLAVLVSFAACGDRGSVDGGDGGDDERNEQNVDDKTDANDDEDNDEPDEQLSAEEIYNKSQEKMSELDSYTELFVFDYDVEISGTTVMTIDITDVSYIDAASNRYYSSSETVQTGTTEDSAYESSMTTYYDKSEYMFQSDSFKKMADMTDKAWEYLAEDDFSYWKLDYSAFVNCSVQKNSDGYVISAEGLSPDAELHGIYEETDSFFGEDKSGRAELNVTVTVDKEYRITSIAISYETETDGSSCSIDIKATFSDFNASADKIVRPDDTGYGKWDIDMLVNV